MCCALQPSSIASKKPIGCGWHQSMRPLVKGDFIKRRALMLPEAARYDTLLNLPSGASLGGALVAAMHAIVADLACVSGCMFVQSSHFI